MTRIIQTGAAVQQPGMKLMTFIPVRVKRRGGRKVVVQASTDKIPDHDALILTALSRAFHWHRLIDEGVVNSGSGIAGQEGLHLTTVNELMRLALLSLGVVRSILDGRQPKTLSLIWLKNNLLPTDWTNSTPCLMALTRRTGLQCFRLVRLPPNHRPGTPMKSRGRASASHRSNGEREDSRCWRAGKWGIRRTDRHRIAARNRAITGAPGKKIPTDKGWDF